MLGPRLFMVFAETVLCLASQILSNCDGYGQGPRLKGAWRCQLPRAIHGSKLDPEAPGTMHGQTQDPQKAAC